MLQNLAGLVLKLQDVLPEDSRENWPGWGFVESVIMFGLWASHNDFLHCPYHRPPGIFDLSPRIWQTRGCLQWPVQPFHYMHPPEIWRCWPPPQLCRCWWGVGSCAASSWSRWSIPRSSRHSGSDCSHSTTPPVALPPLSVGKIVIVSNETHHCHVICIFNDVVWGGRRAVCQNSSGFRTYPCGGDRDRARDGVSCAHWLWSMSERVHQLMMGALVFDELSLLTNCWMIVLKSEPAAFIHIVILQVSQTQMQSRRDGVLSATDVGQVQGSVWRLCGG